MHNFKYIMKKAWYLEHRIDERFIQNVLTLRYLASRRSPGIWEIGLGAEGFLQRLLDENSCSFISTYTRGYKIGKKVLRFMMPQEYQIHLMPELFSDISLPKALGYQTLGPSVPEQRRATSIVWNLDTDVDDYEDNDSDDKSILLSEWDVVDQERETMNTCGELRGIYASKDVGLSDTVLSALSLYESTVVRVTVMCERAMHPLTDREVRAIQAVVGHRATLTRSGE